MTIAASTSLPLASAPASALTSATSSSKSAISPEEHLKIIVIGAGLYGLSAAIALRLAGHEVTVLETMAALEEAGAGLQITPNGTRLLRRWGVDKLLRGATPPESFTIRRFDGRLLAYRNEYNQELEERYGSPLWCVHRADLQQALAERAIGLQAQLRLGTPVAHVDADHGAVVLQSGETIIGDLILGADGLWSTTRSAMFTTSTEQTPQPLPTGDLAYRILVNRELIHDAELARQLEEPGIHIWVGPGAHAVAYSVRGARWINLVLLVPDTLPPHVHKAEGELAEMRALFQGWDPVLTRVLAQTDKVLKWRLNHLRPLARWTTANAKLVVGGDCAHPMLPYMAQGANSSLEDAATLGALLSHVHDREQLSPALALYDAIRRPRVDQLVRETFAQGKEHHLPDGPEQQQRDARLARSWMPEHGPRSGEPWTHPKIQPWVYGYDAYAEAEAAFTEAPF